MDMTPSQHPFIDNIPELETRPLLLEYLDDHPNQRRKFFRYVANVISLAGRLVGHNLGSEVLAVYYRRYLQEMEEWEEILRKEFGRPDGDRIYNQAVGCLKNVYLNALNRVQRKVWHRSTSPKGAPYFVLRNLERNPHRGSSHEPS